MFPARHLQTHLAHREARSLLCSRKGGRKHEQRKGALLAVRRRLQEVAQLLPCGITRWSGRVQDDKWHAPIHLQSVSCAASHPGADAQRPHPRSTCCDRLFPAHVRQRELCPHAIGLRHASLRSGNVWLKRSVDKTRRAPSRDAPWSLRPCPSHLPASGRGAVGSTRCAGPFSCHTEASAQNFVSLAPIEGLQIDSLKISAKEHPPTRAQTSDHPADHLLQRALLLPGAPPSSSCQHASPPFELASQPLRRFQQRCAPRCCAQRRLEGPSRAR